VVAGCAAGAAGCTLIMALFADGLPAAVPLRFATGAFLAGVYPVCMKLMASWSPPAGRALAMGALIGCLALGSALPHLIEGLGQLNWRAVLTAAAATTFCAAIVAGALLRPGPQFPARGRTGRSRYALAMFADRGPRLVNLAYFGHMWELYALWTWLPTFLAVSRTTTTGLPAPGASGIDAFLAIGVAGLAGCLLGGWAADRLGRAATAAAALTVSGACCLLSPLFFTASRRGCSPSRPRSARRPSCPGRSARTTSTGSPISAGTVTPCTTTSRPRRRHGSARSSSRAG
jgi:MFS family permease